MSEVASGLSVVQAQIHGKYYIIHFVHPHGSVDTDVVLGVYEEMFGHKENPYPYYYGPFDNLDALAKFCFRLCDETGGPQVNILSLEEYNQLIEASPSVSVFRERLPTLGNVIANPDASSKKGLFGKLFN